MKKLLGFVVLLSVIAACAVKKPYTDQLRQEYNLNKDNIKKVQFYTSSTIVLERKYVSGKSGTGTDGSLVSNTSSKQDRIIIPANTKCIFEQFGPENELVVRFEQGKDKTLEFIARPVNNNTAKYYLKADWQVDNGGKISYGNQDYYATSTATNAFIMVKIKNLQKNQRNDRIIKGMKV